MTASSTDSDLTLRLVRDVPISPAQCFAGWTVPELLMPWFCPRPWRVVACTLDPRPGGAFCTTMQSPEGETQPEGVGCYLAVEAPHRLVWTNLLGPGYKPQAISHPGFGLVCELRFDPLPDGGTRHQAQVHHVDAAGRNAHAAMGFEQGWAAALEQLVALVQQAAAA
jgi:uncharacterized protein YndB with AHSA1/START domain